jgi:hypothetical protein
MRSFARAADAPHARLLLPVFTLAFLALMAPAAGAGTPTVDPSTLQPVPPPGATCRLDGRFVICRTQLHQSFESEPTFDLPCGTVYETSRDDRDGIRWYSNGLLVRRRVTAVLAGFWTLSPAGGAPRVAINAHWNWWAIPAVPGGDMDSETITTHGNEFVAKAPGGGVIAHIAGLDLPDGTHRGVLHVADDPVIAAALCDALS